MITYRTPKGKRVTERQYLALHRALCVRTGDSPPCEHGHFGCAVWEDGPCTDEIMTVGEANGEEY